MMMKIFIFPIFLTVLFYVGKISGEKRAECGSVLPPDPNSYCCGVDVTVTNRIVGGEPTGLKQYPWLALVEYTHTRATHQVQFFCGAFLISSRYVVTAAHCVTGKIMEFWTPTGIRLGEYNKTNPGQDCVYQPGGMDCTTAISVPIEKIMVHERYAHAPNILSVNNDIALIKLKKLAPYTDHIRPICLPSTDFTVNPPPGLRLYVAGWGTMKQIKTSTGYKNIDSHVKQHVAVPYVPFEKCRNVQHLVTKSHICAGGNHKDACMGDSGGPLMLSNDGVYEAVGVVIVSYGPGAPCGIKGVPGVYTKVFDFKQWIMQKINMNEKSIW